MRKIGLSAVSKIPQAPITQLLAEAKLDLQKAIYIAQATETATQNARELHKTIALTPAHQHGSGPHTVERFCSTHNTYENYARCLGTTNANIGFEFVAGQTYVATSVLIWQVYGLSIASVGFPCTCSCPL